MNTTVQENAGKALQYFFKKENGRLIYNFRTAPKWVNELVEYYFSSDSVHLWYDDPGLSDLEDFLKKVSLGEKFRGDHEIYFNFLCREIKMYTCKHCGKEYEDLEREKNPFAPAFCSMSCLNENMFEKDREYRERMKFRT